jgi:hypothetical protein
MRRVFSSARLENVEAVAKLLEDAGIESRVTNGRSYKNAIRGNFSYRDDGKQLPAVWIVKSEDQPRAREMLRAAGLMDSSRNAPDSYLAMSFRGTNPDPRDADGDGARKRRAFRIKLGLLVVIAAVVALAFMSFRPDHAPAPVAVATSIAASLPARGTAPVPESLALAMLRGELPDDADSVACIAIDARDPTPAFLALLPKTAATVVPVSRCPAKGRGAVLPLLLAVGRYESTVPSGAGIVYLVRRRGTGPVVPRWYEARPEGDGWRVIQPL